MTAGEKWQCAELINRLYLTKGWISSTWRGDAGQPMWDNTPGNLTKQANGSIAYLGPGDVVLINVYLNGAPEGGRALIVNDAGNVSSGTVNLVSQNSGYLGTSEPVVTGMISNGSVSVGGGGGGWSYTTIGVVHAPSSVMTVPSVTGYAGDRMNDIDLSWSQASGGVGGVSGYQVFRNGIQIGSTGGAGATSFNDDALPPGTPVSYQVRAVDRVGNVSALSGPLSLETVLPGQSGLAWVSAGGHPAYCRRVGNNNVDPTAKVRCTTYTGTKWVTVTSGGGTDWGYDEGRAWISAGGQLAYCRRVGNNNGDPTAKLRCTIRAPQKWVTVTRGGYTDWGYDVGWAWLAVDGHPTYCRRVGNNNGDPTAKLRCTSFTGKTWVTQTSGGYTDWGYNTGWAWLDAGGHPAYCRRVGNNNGDPTAKVRCTTDTASGWITATSGGGTDWGYEAGQDWVTADGHPAYCRRVGNNNGDPTAKVRCTIDTGQGWKSVTSAGYTDWGYND